MNIYKVIYDVNDKNKNLWIALIKTTKHILTRNQRFDREKRDFRTYSRQSFKKC